MNYRPTWRHVQIIFNASILRAQQTGIGNYVAELTTALRDDESLQMFFFDGTACNTQLSRGQSGRELRLNSVLRNIPGAYALRRYREQRCFDRAVQQSRPALYHDPSLWPLQFDGPIVITVHDLTHIAHAWTQPAARIREIEKHLPAALQRAQRVLVDSCFIASELQRHYHVPLAKIVVAPLAAAAHFEPRRETQVISTFKKFALNYRRYFLFIGTLEPRKNLLLALRAHAQLPQTLRRYFPLVVIGGDGWLSRDTERELALAVTGGYARKLGYIDNDELADILAGAKLFVFPSLYEGFGIPVLEAMASGVPVVCSDAACLPEVAANAARYFDPKDEVGLAQLLLQLSEDEGERNRLIAAGLERAQLFSWKKCAEITVGAYRAAIGIN